MEIAKRVTDEVQKKHFDPNGLSPFSLLHLHAVSVHLQMCPGTKIVTELVAAGPWWDAEEYHQKYLYKNPTGYQCPNHRLHW